MLSGAVLGGGLWLRAPRSFRTARSSRRCRAAGAVHGWLLYEVGEYLAVGGMPEAVQEWLDHGDLRRCARVQRRLADTYRQDFARYSRKYQVKDVDLLFTEVP